MTAVPALSALRSPVALFLATGLLALVAIVAGTAELSGRAAATEAVADARQTTELLARSVVEPSIPRGLVRGEAGAIDRFDRTVLAQLLRDDVVRVKVWNAEGEVVYSDRTQLIGSRYALDEDERTVLRTGATDAEVSDLGNPENRFERGTGGLLEVYTRVLSPEGTPLLLELYFAADAVSVRRDEIVSQFRPVTLTALGLVVAVATGLLWGLTRRLRRSAEERERLLAVAVEASDAERLRIARDLHDGVVQDLAGATFTVAALSRRHELEPTARHGLSEAAGVLRDSQRALRSLMTEIYPPDLETTGLPSALNDLLAPAQALGVTVRLDIDDVADLDGETLRLLWRVAQEAVRNALRHSGARELRVLLRRGPVDGRLSTRASGRRGGGASRRSVTLEVVDDGCGFDPRSSHPSRFGLRGLEGLVANAGGRVEVVSAPGAGTRVLLTLEGAL